MPENTVKNANHRKRKAAVVLLSGTALILLWIWIIPNLFLPLCQCFSFLPESLYFPLEEFAALHGHHNSLIVSIGGFLLMICTMIVAWKLNGKPAKVYEYILSGVIVILLLAMMMPCLCVPREVARRVRCLGMLKEIYQELSVYAEENKGLFPASFPVKEKGHPVLYYGEGRSLGEPAFLLLEDAARSHAGDLRHQMWSNGEVKIIYPWKNDGTYSQDPRLAK